MLKALLVLGIFQFLSRLSGHVGKQLDKGAKLNLKTFDVTDWKINFSINKNILTMCRS